MNFQIGDIVWNMHTRSVAQIAGPLKAVQLPDGMIVSAHKLCTLDGAATDNWCGKPSDLRKIEAQVPSTWDAIKLETRGWDPTEQVPK